MDLKGVSVMEGGAAIVTGGGQGIGKAVSSHLLRLGYGVMIADVDDEAGTEAMEVLSPLGEVGVAKTDVAVEADVARLVDVTLSRFGRIDLLVNNAAVSCRRPVSELTLEEWNRVIGVNLTGVFLCSKYAAPSLARNTGVIINISSTRALMSEANTEAYTASKGGVVALTHALAVSLAPQVRVNCVSPGWIDVTLRVGLVRPMTWRAWWCIWRPPQPALSPVRISSWTGG
jgi:NAD(P)-dependent dehydrogenase (short-subunit alcohol dehydrogenase family)